MNTGSLNAPMDSSALDSVSQEGSSGINPSTSTPVDGSNAVSSAANSPESTVSSAGSSNYPMRQQNSGMTSSGGGMGFGDSITSILGDSLLPTGAISSQLSDGNSSNAFLNGDIMDEDGGINEEAIKDMIEYMESLEQTEAPTVSPPPESFAFTLVAPEGDSGETSGFGGGFTSDLGLGETPQTPKPVATPPPIPVEEEEDWFLDEPVVTSDDLDLKKLTLVEGIRSLSDFAYFEELLDMTGAMTILANATGKSTVLAPNNEAFMKMDPIVRLRYKKPEFSIHLKAVVSAHIYPNQELKSDKFKDGQILVADPLLTLDPEDIVVGKPDKKITHFLTEAYLNPQNLTNPPTNYSTAVVSDIRIGNNNYIHSLDTVLLPSGVFADLTGAINRHWERYSIYSELYIASGLPMALEVKYIKTVLAPNNAAFGLLPEGSVEYLLDPANSNILAGLIRYQTSPILFNFETAKLSYIPTLLPPAPTIPVSEIEGLPAFRGVQIAGVQLFTNGIIYEMPQVLIP